MYPINIYFMSSHLIICYYIKKNYNLWDNIVTVNTLYCQDRGSGKVMG